MVAATGAEVPMDISDYIDSLVTMVSDYFAICPEEYSAEVIMPATLADQYTPEEIEEYLAWLPDLLSEAGEDRCSVSYEAESREIRVERP